MTKTGADISHHQPAFDAARYAAAEDFVIFKATEDDGFTDPTFTGRWQAAGRARLPRGAYHFARPGRATVDAQADHFLRVVRAAGFGPGDAWALDLEDAGNLGPATLMTWAERWIGRVRAALGGRGLFYTGVAFVFDALGDPGRIPGGCLGWIARYCTDGPYAAPYRRPRGWPEVPDVWQCTNGTDGCIHNVASVGLCDWNRATDAAFAALFGGDDMPTVDEIGDELVKRLGADATHPYTGTAIRAAVDKGNAAQAAGQAAINERLGLVADRLAALEAKAAQPIDLETLAALVAGKLEVAGFPNLAITGEARPIPPA
ncbi:MAG TPA: GH25 family lysozyme [Actinomycetes bacterium]|jgi:lysozyme|nr:GH25 family lysozyme [Actinomycetes bacterium]